jgi:hypothetical protein
MAVLGDWNWYLPKWLEWLPRVGSEPHIPPPALPDPELPDAPDAPDFPPDAGPEEPKPAPLPV